MYAILVNEPGADVSSYVLSTGAQTSESAMQLMTRQAEEFIDEQREVADQAEDYTIIPSEGYLKVSVIRIVGDAPKDVIKFTAHCIDRVM